jgi:hypothetical protein
VVKTIRTITWCIAEVLDTPANACARKPSRLQNFSPRNIRVFVSYESVSYMLDKSRIVGQAISFKSDELCAF